MSGCPWRREPLTEAEKRRIVSAHEAGVNIARIAKIYGVSVATISKILKESK
jgi:transposase-like protein